jgi:hypothetical protein
VKLALLEHRRFCASELARADGSLQERRQFLEQDEAAYARSQRALIEVEALLRAAGVTLTDDHAADRDAVMGEFDGDH